MSQLYLGPGPGNTVEDTLAAELLDGSNITATGQGSWVKVNRVEEVVAVLTTGACTGTSVTCDIEVEAADDSSGTNTVSLGKFDTLTEASDSVEKFLPLRVFKPWIRASYVVAGTTPVVPATLKVRDRDYHLSEERSA